MKTIIFSIPGDPIAKGRPKFSRRGSYVHAYTPEKTRAAEDAFILLARPHRPEAPLDCPIRLMAIFEMPIPDSWPKWKRALALTGEYLHVSPPDVDNLVKLVKDAMNGTFWIDDSQVVCVKAVKRYSVTPQTRIEIYPLRQAERRKSRRAA